MKKTTNFQSLSEEAPGIVHEVMATLDCLLVLHASGDIEMLRDSTVATMLGRSAEKLSKAYDLMTTTKDDEKGEAV